MIQQELMTTREVAAYLRIKERKVYELISARRIPCSRVAGKWLFPKVLIDLWVVQNSAIRLVARQEGAGSRLLFEHLLREQHLDPTTLHFIGPPVRSETELALAVRDGKADAGFGIAAVARQCRVDFVPLQRERYDLVIGRRD